MHVMHKMPSLELNRTFFGTFRTILSDRRISGRVKCSRTHINMNVERCVIRTLHRGRSAKIVKHTKREHKSSHPSIISYAYGMRAFVCVCAAGGHFGRVTAFHLNSFKAFSIKQMWFFMSFTLNCEIICKVPFLKWSVHVHTAHTDQNNTIHVDFKLLHPNRAYIQTFLLNHKK